MQSVAWEDLLLAHVDNVDDMWEVFKNELLNRIETFIPKMKKDSWSRPLPPIVREKQYIKSIDFGLDIWKQEMLLFIKNTNQLERNKEHCH